MENNEKQKIDEEERRFRVQKIEKYEEMLDETEKKINYSAFSIGCSVLGITTISAALGVVLTSSLLKGILDDYIILIGGFILSCSNGVMAFLGAKNLKDLISNIANKYLLQTNLNMLNDEFEISENLGEERQYTKHL